MYNNSFFKKILVVASVVFLYSCDKDYNEIGGDLIGENNFGLEKQTYSVYAYGQKTGPIQSNNLDVNPLGIYNNPNFGETTANFATQLTITEPPKSIGTRPYIESVVLTIPYYIDALKTVFKTDGSREYKLDSIYGPDKAEMKLSIYESGYFMRDTDPIGGFVQPQKYFTDQNADFDNVKNPNRLNDDSNVAQNDKFFFDPAEHIVTLTDTVTKVVTTTRTPPGMQLNLNKGFFKTKIIDAVASGKLASNPVFKEYFRGLYFKMEKSGSSPGNAAMLNFRSKDAKITIKYNEDLSTTVGAVTTITRVKKTIVLDLTGNSVSLQNTNYSNSGMAYNALPNTGNSLAGDEKVYLKGGEGSVGVLELFDKKDLKGYDTNGVLTGPNGISDELDDLRNEVKGNRLLINEANLVFHIDAAAMAGNVEPLRLYIYDFKNNRPIVDYFLDGTTNSLNPKKDKLIYDGNISTSVTTKRGIFYKFRITNHVRNLVKYKDSTNVKLGLVITENIENFISHKVKTPNAFITAAPKASVMNPLGTILFGNNIPVGSSNYDKKLKFEIYYTKPN